MFYMVLHVARELWGSAGVLPVDQSTEYFLVSSGGGGLQKETLLLFADFAWASP